MSGPAQVPMMSPNGSVPPIYVPPGYAPQVIEDNGVRRVVVVPQAPEFHPGGHAVIHRPPHPPLPSFLPLPTMIPPPPRHMYSPVTGAGDMATQYIPQYHTAQVYGDVDPLPAHGRSNFRDERSSKTYERLQKKLKDRHGTQKDKLNSPPSSPQKCPSPTSEHNGLTKGQEAGGISTGSTKSKFLGKGKSNSQTDTEVEEKDEETKALEALLSNIAKPVLGTGELPGPCSSVGFPWALNFLQATPCSNMGSCTGYGWMSAPAMDFHGLWGMVCLTMVYITDCKGISAPVPGVPPPLPSSLTLVSAELFLFAYSHSSLWLQLFFCRVGFAFFSTSSLFCYPKGTLTVAAGLSLGQW